MNVTATLDRTLREEIDASIQVLIRLRQVLEVEMNQVLNSANPGVPKGALTSMKQIAACLDSLVDSKVRLDKNAKAMADAMSSEDEESAVRSWIRALDKRKRMAFLDDEIKCLSQS